MSVTVTTNIETISKMKTIADFYKLASPIPVKQCIDSIASTLQNPGDEILMVLWRRASILDQHLSSTIMKYSDKAIVVRTTDADTITRLVGAGGKFNRNLGGQPGIIFPTGMLWLAKKCIRGDCQKKPTAVAEKGPSREESISAMSPTARAQLARERGVKNTVNAILQSYRVSNDVYTIEKYSDKALVVRASGGSELTPSQIAALQSIGGKWAPKLTQGGPGVIFPKKDKIVKKIDAFLASERGGGAVPAEMWMRL